MAQGGDFSKANGTGGESIYGRTFDDENFSHKHYGPGMLSMANAGKNTNGSQFFITFNTASHLNGKHVVFGRLTSGLEILREIERVAIGRDDKPIQDITVVNCGEIINDSGEEKEIVPVKVVEKEKEKKDKNKEEIDIDSSDDEDEQKDKDNNNNNNNKDEKKKGNR
jgi:cyclophilin family peptidyl-prolyl cis-trans isomerase